jgi:hypothetical protein
MNHYTDIKRIADSLLMVSLLDGLHEDATVKIRTYRKINDQWPQRPGPLSFQGIHRDPELNFCSDFFSNEW